MPADNEPVTRASFIRRELGNGSRFAWSVVGLAVIAGATSLASMVWHGGGVAVILGTLLVASYVLRRLGPVVPFPDHVRQRWARRQRLREKYTSYFYAGFFWVGAGMLIGALFSSWRHDSFEPANFVVPGFAIVLGGVASLWWLLVDKKTEEKAANTTGGRTARS